jgi:hypothetical protein
VVGSTECLGQGEGQVWGVGVGGMGGGKGGGVRRDDQTKFRRHFVSNDAELG